MGFTVPLWLKKKLCTLLTFSFPSIFRVIERNDGQVPLTYKRFQSIIAGMEVPCQPENSPTIEMVMNCRSPTGDDHDDTFGVPTLEELGMYCQSHYICRIVYVNV